MKLLYSQLKKLLPDLSVNPSQLRNDLTSIGYFTNYVEKFGDRDWLFDIDVKVNRGDCLGYFGLAGDLSVYYDLPLVKPTANLKYDPTLPALNIDIRSADVIRIMAVSLSQVTIGPTPKDIKNLLLAHQINPINNLVDLTNYAMLVYGLPNHAFDTPKTSKLIWQNNTTYDEFISLDGTTLKLKPHNLLITNDSAVLSLSFIGGQNSGINSNTTDITIEMAIYNPSRVRHDSRQLKTQTEASTRLEKNLDPDLIPTAFNYLVSLIKHHCHGQISSSLFDHYPHPDTPKSINFNPLLPGLVAGIDIPALSSLDILTRLGCTINHNQVTPPSIRKDLSLEADLVEEVVRFFGIHQIPADQPLKFITLPDITPKIIYLIEQIKDILVSLGYDEIRSWPMVSVAKNPATIVKTQNCINSEYPYLRQNLSHNLQFQTDQYHRFKLTENQFFEIGKIFSQKNHLYQENYSLAVYHHSVEQLKTDLDSLFSKLNLPLPSIEIDQNIAEIILDNLQLPADYRYQPQIKDYQAIELNHQIITLDANLILGTKEDPSKLVDKYSRLIDNRILWQILISDIYHDQTDNVYRYTFRVSYYNCDDKTAKKVHLAAFDLNTPNTPAINRLAETKLLYYQDMYLKTCSATIINQITKKDLHYLVFDQTIFFPGGGGQPADQGTISHQGQSLSLTGLSLKNGQILHQVDTNQFRLGDQVTLNLDWNHRYHYMKIHSAGHLLHEVVMTFNNSLVPLKGFHQDQAYLIYQGFLDPSLKDKIELEVNHLILSHLPIICDYTTLEKLKLDARSVPNNLPQDKPLRRLKIGQYPAMADGGIQVKNTKEVGRIRLISLEYAQNQTTLFYQVS